MTAQKPPKGVFYIVILFFIVAAVLIIATADWPWVSAEIIKYLPLGKNTFTKYAGDVVYLLPVGAAIVIIDAIGLYMLKPWARLLALLIGLVLIVVLVGLIVLWYLLTKDEAKQAFGVPATAPEKPANENKADTTDE